MTTTYKIYIHLEEDNHGVNVTIPIVITEDMTVQQVIDIYVTRFNSKYHHDLLYDLDGNIVILSSNHITLKSYENKIYHKHKFFLDVNDSIDNGSNDVFAVRNNSSNSSSGIITVDYNTTKSTVTTSTSTSTSAVVNSGGIIKEKEDKVIAIKDNNTTDESRISNVKIITKEQKSVLTSLLAEKSYRKVREVVSHILSTVVDKNEQLFAFKSLAEVYYHTKRYEKAIEICQKALQQQHSTTTTGHSSMELHYILIKSLMATQDYTEAEIIITNAMKIQSDSKLIKKQPKHMQSISFQLELIALQAESIFEKGQHNEAVAIINQIMSNPNAESNIPILLAYASFAKQYHKLEEPIRALLKAVVLKGDNERVKKMLAELLSSTSGIDELLRQVPPEVKKSSSSSGSSSSSSIPDNSKGKCEVYAFLGYITKTHSCISSSIRLYQLALEAYTTSANSALNLTHLYEISVDYNRCIQTIISFCKSNPTMKLGPHVSCNDVLQLLLNNNSNNSNSNNNNNHSTSSIVTLEWIDIDSDSSNGYVNVTIEYPSTNDSSDVMIDSGLISPSEHGSYKYSELELDLLALFVTAAKILYLQGKISVLPALFRLLEPCRLLSATSLHETTIRNEIAYYQELGRILCYRQKHCSYGVVNTLNTLVDADKLSIQSAHKRPIYLIGDSHCIPGSWSIINVKGQSRLLIPKVATGVKQWHLRKESDFYPKAHFNFLMNTIPDGAEVIFIIGEIDCREGIIQAIDRDYYDSFELAVKGTLKQFLPVLKNYIIKKKLQGFIHPIIPVLDVTRDMVIKYNAAYRAAVEDMKEVKCRWLDFFDDLIEPRSAASSSSSSSSVSSSSSPSSSSDKHSSHMQLRPRYALDGTHLNPSYLMLLESALNK